MVDFINLLLLLQNQECDTIRNSGGRRVARGVGLEERLGQKLSLLDGDHHHHHLVIIVTILVITLSIIVTILIIIVTILIIVRFSPSPLSL